MYDSVFGGHLGERKTRERIRLSFHWPKMRQNIQQYVSTCRDCQLRSRPTKLDRVHEGRCSNLGHEQLTHLLPKGIGIV